MENGIVKAKMYFVFGNRDYYEANLGCNGKRVNIRTFVDIYKGGQLEVRVQDGQNLNWEEIEPEEVLGVTAKDARREYLRKVEEWKGVLEGR